MRTSWQRDEDNQHRARLELEPWQVRLLEGYDPLYDYASTEEVLHAEWMKTELRARAIEVLGEAAVREADVAVMEAPTLPDLATWKAADQANAEAWAKVATEKLIFTEATPRPPRADYGVPLTVGGVRFEWAGPVSKRDVWCHVAPFDPPVRLVGLTDVAAVPGAFIFLRKSAPPYVTTRAGAHLPELERQLGALGVEASAFSRIVVNGVALLDTHAALRLVSQQHVCGASFATTGRSWWVRVDPLLGVVSRTPPVRSEIPAENRADL